MKVNAGRALPPGGEPMMRHPHPPLSPSPSPPAPLKPPEPAGLPEAAVSSGTHSLSIQRPASHGAPSGFGVGGEHVDAPAPGLGMHSPGL